MDNQSLANTSKINGLSIFILSEPVQAYDFIGRVTQYWYWGDVNTDAELMANKVRKRYPTADGIIYRKLSFWWFPSVEVIKFKS